jgi:general secretion pathway protein I
VKRIHGFTLIELMVALAILAVVALTANTRTLDTLVQMQQLEARTLASWMAENEMAALRASRRNRAADPISTGTQTRRQRMAGREWRVEVAVSSTTHPWLRRVEIDVAEVDDQGEMGHRHRLVGFLGQR